MISILTVNICLLFFLAVCAAGDIKTRTVYTPLCILVGLAGLLFSPVIPERSLPESLAGLLPAAGLYALSLLWKNQIGRGDIFVIAACGTWLGPGGTLTLLVIAFLLAGIWSVFLLMRRKASRSTQLPFIPFLLAGQLVRFLL